MKKLIIIITALFFASTSLIAQTKAGKVGSVNSLIVYTCPMHNEVASHESGKCPKCGMDLVLSRKEQMKSKTMKNYTCPLHLEVTKHNPGKCPKCGKRLTLSAKEQMKAETMKIFTCPMHPEIALDKNGNCPKCGNALVEKKEN